MAHLIHPALPAAMKTPPKTLPAYASASQDPSKKKRCSDSQAMASLGTTRSNYCPSTTGTHANKEAMGTLATYDGGLVGAFHENPLNKKNH